MSLKNLLVHLDQGERTAARLAIAASLAREHGARLVGAFGQRGQAQQVGVVSSWPSQEYADARDASKLMFESLTAGLPRAEWHDINRGSDTEVMRHIIDLSRHADMVVLGQHDERAKAWLPEQMVGDVILESGRPVLVIPFAGDFSEIGRHPLIAWSNAREAARALNDALPLIRHCDEATVLSFSARTEEGESSCEGVARHLADHGIRTKTEILLVEDFGIMDMLLNRVTDRGADLLVMGAHGHIGFPFINRGAGTRYILAHMTVPVLMSN